MSHKTITVAMWTGGIISYEPHGTPMAIKSVNASHILVNSEKDANSIMARLAKGESFEDLAKRFSKCPSKSKGGSLGWFGKGEMVPEFEKACFEGKAGEIVGPVRTQFGYHIIRIVGQK